MFGGGKVWKPKNWSPVNDQVRGGSSTSFVSVWNNILRFYGHLDTSTLGGAGFASQRFTLDSPWDWSDFQGFLINIHSGDSKMYSFNLKNLDNDIEYRYSFDSQMVPITLRVKWEDLKATYRGRQVPYAPKLDPSKMSSFSIMCSSYFDKQRGDFSLFVESILLY